MCPYTCGDVCPYTCGDVCPYTCGDVCPYRPNEEKVIYYLLLTRKERQPSLEDEAKAAVGGQLGQWVQVLPVMCDQQGWIVLSLGPSLPECRTRG